MSKRIENIQNLKTKNMFVSVIILPITIIFIVFVNIDSIGYVQVYSQELELNQTQTNQTFSELTGKLIGTTYRWIDSNNTINPTLIITAGVNNQISIKSLKDSQEHNNRRYYL
jgi:hypothetical protein